MKRLLFLLVSFVASAAMVYGVFAYVLWETAIGEWGHTTRAFSAGCTFAGMIVVYNILRGKEFSF